MFLISIKLVKVSFRPLMRLRIMENKKLHMIIFIFSLLFRSALLEEGNLDSKINKDPCALPMLSTFCSNEFDTWYYNQSRDTCELFQYGICGGNANNFKDLYECEHLCKQGPVLDTSSADSCELPPKHGKCRARFPRWYYSKDGTCRRFIYGGCGGNRNKFKTSEKCYEACGRPEDVCKLPMVGHSCDSEQRRWYYNNTIDQCKKYEKGYCGINGNNFANLESCEQRCRIKSRIAIAQGSCHLESNHGPCHSEFERWYYSSNGTCKRFIYGGCKGNRNNFESLGKCYNTCKKATDVCTLPMIVGPCNKGEDAWYYNLTTNTCEKFKYGGCKGNENRFRSFRACKQRCKMHGPMQLPAETLCRLPKEMGPCRAGIRRWYYNNDSMCTEFIYGGCLGNDNNFENKEKCHKTCKNVNDICRLPVTMGACQASNIYWYYNHTTNTCEKSEYGGCTAKGNRFDDLKSCEERCKEVPEDFCRLPPKPGTCRSRIMRWYHAHDGTCKPFIYSGCEGNKNNFESVDECYKTCKNAIDVCTLPMVYGSCNEEYISWYYKQSTSSCEKFEYSGCMGNGNRFEDPTDCEKRCLEKPEKKTRPEEYCHLPPETGPCRAHFPRWYYSSDGTCRKFVYGGCKGNENNFEFSDDCYEACGSVDNLCSLPMVNGSCQTTTDFWYYNKTMDKCDIVKNGCPDNANNFQDIGSCEWFCRKIPPSPAEFCRLPPVHGPCRGRFPHWYYSSDGTCKLFIYGGCRGNGNNFKTADACTATCDNVTDVCNLPMVQGPCRAYFPSWFFNQTTSTCEKFIYGGCEGNGNRFEDVESCQKRCKKA